MRHYLLIALTVIFAAGCGKPGKRTAIGAGAGAAVGAVAGAVIGHQTGNKQQGAWIGAATGAALGGAVGNRLDKQARDLQAIADTKRTENGLITTLKSQLLFDTNSATLSAKAKDDLNQVADILKKYPDDRVTVLGHTDSAGTAEVNQTLSQRRAASVSAQLIARGYPSKNVDVVGRGEDDPIASNETADGRAKNRRVEIQIVAAEALQEKP